MMKVFYFKTAFIPTVQSKKNSFFWESWGSKKNIAHIGSGKISDLYTMYGFKS